jgi:DnaJ-class molecular chaperone
MDCYFCKEVIAPDGPGVWQATSCFTARTRVREMTTPEKPAPVCGLCKGTGVVVNALSWIDGEAHPALPCPRCGGTGRL